MLLAILLTIIQNASAQNPYEELEKDGAECKILMSKN